ncbi:maltooligosyl trehalose synthase [Sediminihabitans luteus]|uniref:Maltooligosyl trehalose synthase n=1 Tax=Sediminihabitans luteus TaxID=1138585 RepID=A0A2M9CQB6_9CELL|nr:malto-oligosyltrehalose synthase [Sediminihabitans luteus]PJJ74122.1 maltooligosyl trehalose synthase [Sediminihabitans luteus]GII97962.1 malto-oligosyltrehalose synthase [Sediminihabitans luteus]
MSARVPTSTYRLQLNADLTFDDAAAQVPYLAALGVTHLYLSPILPAAPGSTHGYDVVDHTRVSDVLGGRAGLDRLAAAAHDAGLGLVVDVVPNHMAVPTPLWHNRALWSVLAHGESSPYAHWFDVDWSAGGSPEGQGAVLMPVLGERVGDVVAGGDLVLDVVDGAELGGVSTGPTTVLRYFDHVFPVRAGTEDLPLAELVERQHYRLAYWKVGDEELNYRRFFDVGTLAAVRVEDESVFDATHEVLIGLLADGTVDGLRIDHPDGLADPAGYLERLAERTHGAWVVVEKILAGDERLPPEWVTAGTTGYEGLWRLQSLFVDPAGRARLAELAPPAGTLEEVVQRAKREVVDGPLYAEVHRLTDLAASVCADDLRLRDHTWRGLHDCLRALLVAFDRYRAYVVPGEETRHEPVAAMAAATERARATLAPDRHATLDVLVELLLGREAGSAGRRREARRDELVVRFQQVCGAVMAKGVEDTAFYRWTELTSLCEVGGEPDRFGIDAHTWHAFATRAQEHAPHALTTTSTHDTKRGEDTRAQIGVLSEVPDEWAFMVEMMRTASGRYRSSLVDAHAESLVLQTLVGTWTPDGPMPGPASLDRLAEYLTKALREAKLSTSWTTPHEAYEAAVVDLVRSLLADDRVLALLATWAEHHVEAVRAVALGTKLVQLTMPGVADVYQGSEGFSPTLVDPDNRRPTDVATLADRLARLDAGEGARSLEDQKLLVTSRALRLRRERPETFVGPDAGYLPLPTSTPCALASARTLAGAPQVVTVATRLATTLARLGGWGEHTVVLPDAPHGWHDLLTGARHASGSLRLADLLASLPVALLVPADAA